MTKIPVYSDGAVLARDVLLCSHREEMGKGLLGKRHLLAEEGALFVLPPYQQGKTGLLVSIHMFFMRFPIAVAWLNKQGEVVHSVVAHPWGIYTTRVPAWYTLELHPSKISCLMPGSVITWEEVS